MLKMGAGIMADKSHVGMTIQQYRTWYQIVHCSACTLSDDHIKDLLKYGGWL
jgi:hypothetical protein